MTAGRQLAVNGGGRTLAKFYASDAAFERERGLHRQLADPRFYAGKIFSKYPKTFCFWFYVRIKEIKEVI